MSENGMTGKKPSQEENAAPGRNNPDCAEFQEQLPGLMGDGADFSSHPHLSTCANCAELVRDLNYIAQQAKLLLPLHDPSPVVWQKIESSLRSKDDKSGSGDKS
jgi:hypothetical protein